jgi:hypothetical protein
MPPPGLTNLLSGDIDSLLDLLELARLREAQCLLSRLLKPWSSLVDCIGYLAADVTQIPKICSSTSVSPGDVTPLNQPCR